jgi:hypothetical protein
MPMWDLMLEEFFFREVLEIGVIIDFAHTTTNVAKTSASSAAFFALTYYSI